MGLEIKRPAVHAEIVFQHRRQRNLAPHVKPGLRGPCESAARRDPSPAQKEHASDVGPPLEASPSVCLRGTQIANEAGHTL